MKHNGRSETCDLCRGRMRRFHAFKNTAPFWRRSCSSFIYILCEYHLLCRHQIWRFKKGFPLPPHFFLSHCRPTHSHEFISLHPPRHVRTNFFFQMYIPLSSSLYILIIDSLTSTSLVANIIFSIALWGSCNLWFYFQNEAKWGSSFKIRGQRRLFLQRKILLLTQIRNK